MGVKGGIDLIELAERLDAVLVDLYFLVEEVENILAEVEAETGETRGQNPRSEGKKRGEVVA